MTIDTLILQ